MNNRNHNLTTVGAVEPATKTIPANYYPCLREGITSSVSIPCNTWDSMEWKVASEKEGVSTLIMIVAFHKGDKIDARMSFMYNIHTGKVISKTYQGCAGFDTDNAFNLHSMQSEREKQRNAKFAIENLIRYFRDINAEEYKKAMDEREVRSTVKCYDTKSADQGDKASSSVKKTSTKKADKVYDPSAKKAPIYIGDGISEKRQYTFHTQKWERHGHYRRYPSGKVVYIKPTTVYRKKAVQA
jgi:hypothetical protein